MRISDWSSDVCSSDLAHRVYAVLMLVVAGFTVALPFATTYPMLLLSGLGLGLAGGSFAVGTVYVSSWFPRERQGMALGLFGMGNVGTAVTGFAAPMLLAVMDWQQVAWIYAGLLLARSEGHTSELQSLMRISYAVFCLNKKNIRT